MLDERVENEIKMFSLGGSFAYDGDDPSEKMEVFRSIFLAEGMRVSEYQVHRYTDYYYTDPEGVFDSKEILLRYRDMGTKAFLTMKMPSTRNGLGLSRREIEGEIVNDSRFDRWKAVQGYAVEHYGEVEIGKVPRLKEHVVRGRTTLRTDVREYTFTFDKVVYVDPVSGVRSIPCYELEFESLDKAIGEDLRMMRVLKVLSDRYLFEEERISKYARGMAFLRSLRE